MREVFQYNRVLHINVYYQIMTALISLPVYQREKNNTNNVSFNFKA